MIRECHDLVDAVILPATQAAANVPSLADRVRELDLPFLLDPRSPTFQFAPPQGTGGRYAPFGALHGPRFTDVFRGRAGFEQLGMDDWRQAAGNVVRLQAELGARAGRAPLAALPPYLAVRSDLARAWLLNLAMLDEVVRLAPDGEPVAAVAVLTSESPAQPDFDALDAMLCAIARRVSTAFIWLDECREQLLGVEAVRRLARLVEAHPDLDLFNLHGGYLSLLLHRFGLAGVGSGMARGEHRRVANLGRPIRRRVPLGYYMPSLHVLVDPGAADAYARAMGDWCSCFACRKLSDTLRPSELDDERLMLHYLLAKGEERQHVAGTDLDGLIDELWVAYHWAAGSVESLPRDLQASFPHHHLENWAFGLSSATVP